MARDASGRFTSVQQTDAHNAATTREQTARELRNDGVSQALALLLDGNDGDALATLAWSVFDQARLLQVPVSAAALGCVS